METVKHVKVREGMKVSELIKEMSGAGVMGGGRIARGVEIFGEMVRDKQCKVFFGLAGAMVPGGMKQIVIDMLEQGWIDVLVSTGANLTHDLVESLGFNHYKSCGNVSDAELHKKGIDRIYDSFMKNEVYGKMEDFFRKHADEFKGIKTVKEFLWKLGMLMPEKSILGICARRKIPVFCPAISDSGIGLMMWNLLVSGKELDVKEFYDLKEILDIAWTAKKAGVFYVGGGTPKNYIQQAMQFTKGASYGVQITMDRAETGGSSGAPLVEGVSWGKMKEGGKFVDVICDATIALPLIYAGVLEQTQDKNQKA